MVTTAETKVSGIEKLRFALGQGMIRFHSRFHGLLGPTMVTPQDALRESRRKLFEQLYAFKSYRKPSGAIVFSGKAQGCNDDLIMALSFLTIVELSTGAFSRR
jgi:hypothetical protein